MLTMELFFDIAEWFVLVAGGIWVSSDAECIIFRLGNLVWKKKERVECSSRDTFDLRRLATNF